MFETEKQGLERENQRLKVQVKEMEELLGGKRRGSTTGLGLTTSQSDLRGPSKELLDLQHAYHKLSRQYEAKIAELREANSRMEQNEAEVKKLRFRVEELKQGLCQKEMELDDFLNQIHKLQRALDEQKKTNENLETELRHLQN
ncbi:coiled-coil domain-containing protein 102B-like [Talpa occidentalis]|uniref:coiled-coil domain-containing protein 102B-like n=1 Tax=Talpa occidentalis TaxID=50954 RepID=UPI00188E6078|nr:coiled-coil domain-containing protein 102B-like [Talpa occidentalis]